MIKHFPRSNITRVFLRPNTWLKAFTGPVHCQKLSQNGHRGSTKSFSSQTQDQSKCFCSRQRNTRPMFLFHLFIFYFFFFHDQKLLRSSTWQEKFSVRRHDQKSTKTKIFLRFNSRPNISSGRSITQNLLSGTNNSKMLLGSNTAGRETHEPTTRKNVRQTNRKFRVIAGQMELKH